MELPVICRTCDAKVCNSLYELSTRVEKYPEQTLADLLKKLTAIDIADKADKLPQCMCSSCMRKLKNAFDFVVQARAANDLLVRYHLQKSLPLGMPPPDCLQESPMELCAEDHVEVKMETEADLDAVTNPTYCELVEQTGPDADIEADMEMTKKTLDPLVMPDAVKEESDVESYSKGFSSDSEQVGESDNDDEDSLDDLPLKQRAQKWKPKAVPPKIKRKTKKLKTDRQLKRKHEKDYVKTDIDTTPTMPKRSGNLNDRKKAKDIDANLCKPHGYKLIQCMICQSKYDKIAQLRRHLEEHPDIGKFDEHHEIDLSELVELFYPDIKQLNADQLKTRIREDLAAGKYERFYSITNQSGYEMDLESSETESETEFETDEKVLKRAKATRGQYLCELCQQRFQRKYQLYEHQLNTHPWSEAPHTCGRCDARFVSSKLLTHHYESQCKNAQKRFICHKCPLRFRWKHNLKAHYREHKGTNQTFECHECKRVFDKKKSLTVHLLSIHADESKLIPCQWCSRKFYRRDYLVKHLKRHGLKEQDIPLAETLIAATSKPNGLKNIICKICNLQFERIVDLRAHIQLELKLAISLHRNYESLHNYSITNESGFEIQLEDSETEDESRPAASSALYRTPSLYVCELCNVQCRRKYEMIQHQRTMHRFDKMPYECELCIFKCVSQNIMEYHKHSQCLSEEKKHVCGKCGYKFMWPENLQQHLRLQHSDQVEVSTLPKMKVTATSVVDMELLKCPHCDRTYQMKSRLNNHIRDVHINGDRKRKEAMKKFLCSLCGKETRSASDLVTHMRRHTGEKPFKCDLCEMAFPRHFDMTSHRRMHTGEKPFHCTVCGKDFARSYKLKRHMLTHSGLKPHKCTYCEKSYRQSKDLNLHMQQHTGECPFICGTCGERFIQNSTLEKHRMMRRHFDEVKQQL